jgi:hypothetical protein
MSKEISLTAAEAREFLSKNPTKVICAKLNDNEFLLLKLIEGNLHKVFLTDEQPIPFNGKLKKYNVWYNDFIDSMYQSKFINTKISYMEGRIK